MVYIFYKEYLLSLINIFIYKISVKVIQYNLQGI